MTETKLSVRMVNLEPMKVASAHGFGPEPEGIAWDRLLSYIKRVDLLADGKQHRFLGFNNPNPTPGSPNYGYEQWVTLSGDAPAAEGITFKVFPGGLYAVARCTLGNIVTAWQELVAWRESSRYWPAAHLCLEECLGPVAEKGIDENTEFDLYLPIGE